MVLGIASTALPFARSPEDEAERWLRILRMHGQAAVALQSVGVSEAPMEPPAARPAGEQPPPRESEPSEGGVVEAVSERAADVAAGRGASTVGAGDVLLAVMDVYGGDFDRVLRVHGTDREEVVQSLASHTPGVPDAA